MDAASRVSEYVRGKCVKWRSVCNSAVALLSPVPPLLTVRVPDAGTEALADSDADTDGDADY